MFVFFFRSFDHCRKRSVLSIGIAARGRSPGWVVEIVLDSGSEGGSTVVTLEMSGSALGDPGTNELDALGVLMSYWLIYCALLPVLGRRVLAPTARLCLCSDDVVAHRSHLRAHVCVLRGVRIDRDLLDRRCPGHDGFLDSCLPGECTVTAFNERFFYEGIFWFGRMMMIDDRWLPSWIELGRVYRPSKAFKAMVRVDAKLC